MHIQETVGKAKKLLGFFYRTFGCGGRRCLSRLYKSIVLPRLDYCCSLWDPSHSVHIANLERVQTFAARIITKAWSASGEALRMELQWPTLASRRGFQKLVLCRRILMGGSIIPSSFFALHQRPSRSHRNSTPLYRPLLRTRQHFTSFRYSVVPLWNSIPEEVVSFSLSTLAFKRRLKLHLYML